MCRLLMISATDLGSDAYHTLVCETLYRGAAEKNEDGFGIFSHKYGAAKSGGSVIKEGAWWMPRINPENFTLGHVRAASFGTDKTAKAAHPFVFRRPDDETKLLFAGMHNGAFDASFSGYSSSDYEGEVINSDSFRAFCVLSKMIKDQNREIDADLISRWLEHYEETSAYAIMIAHRTPNDDKNMVTVFRNALRGLFISQIGNGYYITTSHEVMRNVLSVMKARYNIEGTEPELMPEDVLYQFVPGDTVPFAVRRLDAQMKPRYVYAAKPVQTGGNKTANINVPTVYNRNTQAYWSNWEDDYEGWTDTNFGVASPDAESQKKRDKSWDELRDMLKPMRAGLAEIYCAVVLNKQNTYCEPEVDWAELTFDELEAVKTYLRAHPISREMNDIIHKWNDKVTPIFDTDWVVHHFGAAPFWLWDDFEAAERIVNKIQPR